MKLAEVRGYDVVVVGSGIAATMAAVAAARGGARVGVVCLGPLFSGSSFYPGTWGLGLVGPQDEGDAADLEETIERIGCGMALPSMVRAFVEGINPSIEHLESLGVVLKSAASSGEREFIPCFDYKCRAWHGIVRDSYEKAVGGEIERVGIDVRSRCELLDVVVRDGAVAGAVVFNRASDRLESIRCSSLVLATGGVGGLFKRRLTASDVVGSAQAIALRCGCSLVNFEFMQIMPGIVDPVYGVVFNEKTFRYMALRTPSGKDPFEGRRDAQEMLECRSGHGPFTSRLASKEVDLAIDAAGAEGMTFLTRPLHGPLPEFVQTYASWLKEEKGVSFGQKLKVAPFAHAANGGVLIDERANTGVPGLFACGEASGGMHGADRLGGLSSANGLVFGIRAGREAGKWAGSRRARGASEQLAWEDTRLATLARKPEGGLLGAVESGVRDAMSSACMVTRTEEGLARAASIMDELARQLAASCSGGGFDPRVFARGVRASHQLDTARAMIAAALARRESRGSHYRADFPKEDAAFSAPRRVALRPPTGGVGRPACFEDFDVRALESSAQRAAEAS